MQTKTERLVKPWETRYGIQNTTVLAEVPQLRVLDMTLMPGEFVPWHRHPNNADLFIGLAGQFEIHFDADRKVTVGSSQRQEIAVDVPHAVINVSSTPCQFLVIQGVGLYNYIPVDRVISHLQEQSA